MNRQVTLLWAFFGVFSIMDFRSFGSSTKFKTPVSACDNLLDRIVSAPRILCHIKIYC